MAKANVPPGIRAVNEKLAGIAEGMAALSTRITSVESGQMSEWCKKVEANFQQAAENFSSLHERVERLEQTVKEWEE